MQGFAESNARLLSFCNIEIPYCSSHLVVTVVTIFGTTYACGWILLYMCGLAHTSHQNWCALYGQHPYLQH
jgi:hypothetical protein